MDLPYSLAVAAVALATVSFAQPDLVVRSLEVTGVDDLRNSAGQTVTLAIRLVNRGDETASRNALGVYLSRDAQLSDNDCFLGQFAINNPLPPTGNGPARAVRRQIAVRTSGIVGGEYYLIVEADYLNSIRELREVNNTAATRVTLRGTAADGCSGGAPDQGGDDDDADDRVAGADLAISGALVEDSRTVAPSDLLGIEYVVRNRGTVNINSVSAGYYLSEDGVLDAGDRLLDVESLGSSIDVGESEPEADRIPLPANTAPGDYFLLVVVDPSNGIDEVDETNNVLAAPFTVIGNGGGLPSGGGDDDDDDGFADVSVTAALDGGTQVFNEGDRVSLDYFVRNNGSVELEELIVGFYLSEDASFDGGDIFLESEDLGSDVEPGTVEPEFEQVPLPEAVASGDYFLLVVLDPGDRVSETNENNNVAALPIEIIGSAPLPAGSDLVVVAARAQAGDGSVTLDFTVANEGAIATGLFYVTFYLTEGPTRTGAERWFAYATILRVDGGTTERINGTVSVNDAALSDANFVVAVVDYLDGVDETDESNNTTAVALTPAGASATSRANVSDEATWPLIARSGDGPGASLAASPNPASDFVTLRIAGATLDDAPAEVTVVDPSGRIVSHGIFAAESPIRFDVSGLLDGVYLARVLRGGEVSTTRFVVR